MRFKVLLAAFAVSLLPVTAAAAAGLTDQPLVDAGWLKQHLGDSGLVVLDVRDLTKAGNPYAQGHIPGAVDAQYSSFGWRANIGGAPGMLPPPDQIAAKIASLGINNDTEVVIVPAGTDANEFGGATRIYWTFKVLGHDNVTLLNGGYRAWAAAGDPLSTDAVTPAKGNFTPNYRPELRADIASVEKAIQGDANLVDARSVAQFIGKEKTPTVKELGSIPTAVNINFTSFYDDKTATFVDKNTIDGLLKKAGLEGKDNIITFCNTGHLATLAWFGLSQVEGLKNVKLYDGSMSQWTLDPSRPVVVHQ
ncbi:MAG TPA: sulfurtransferase [Devosiaceae bacterium]|nr:sulfurtransferase [Devosiaceae bacterium]